MRCLTLADAHLLHPEESRWQDWFKWVETEAAKSDLLVFNGDLFEFFVGRQRKALRHYRPVLDALAALADKTEVVLIQGNHDFHLQRSMPGGVSVLDVFEVSDGGVTTRWLHGDVLDPSWKYQALRGFLRTEFVRFGTEYFPPHLAWQLALGWSSRSRDHSPDTTPEDLQLLLPGVNREFDRGCQRLLTGHYHYRYDYTREDGAEWFAMGPWMTGRWFVQIDDGVAKVKQFGSNA